MTTTMMGEEVEGNTPSGSSSGESELKRQLGKTREQIEEARRRLWRPTVPLIASTGVLLIAAVGWISPADGIGGQAVNGTILASVAVLGTVVARWQTRRNGRPVWCPKRANVATGVGALWVVLAVTTGPSWPILFLLALAMLLLGTGFWRDVRIPDYEGQGKPVAPPVDMEHELPAFTPRPDEEDVALDDDEDSVEQVASKLREAWQRDVQAKGGHVPGASLTEEEQGDTWVKWTVVLPEGGKSTFTHLESKLENIVASFDMPDHQVQLERHPNNRNRYAVLTVITKDVLAEPVEVTTPQWFWDGENGWIEFGLYQDQVGQPAYQVYSKNSMHDMVLLGAKGYGKSALMNYLVYSAMSSGLTTVFYLDGTNGDSSPLLQAYADWAPTGEDAEEVLLSGLENAMRERGLYMQRWKLAGITPSPDMPGIMVVIDECHNVLSGPNAERWGKVIRHSRKYAICLLAATQDSGGEAFGGAGNRDLLADVTQVALRGSGTDRGMGMDLSTEDLPMQPGWGRMRAKNARNVPFRTFYFDEEKAAELMAQLPGVELDKRTARAFGEKYERRREIAAAYEEELRRYVDGDDADMPEELHSPIKDQADEFAELESQLGDLYNLLEQVEAGTVDGVELPNDGAGGDSGLSQSAELVLTSVQTGATARREMEERTGYSGSQVDRALKELITAGRVTKDGYGKYAPVE